MPAVGDDRRPDAAVLACEVGGTHVAAALVELGTPVFVGPVQRRRLQPLAGSAELLDTMAACARDALSTSAALLSPAQPSTELPRHPVPLDWGFAMPGPFDYRRGVAYFAGVGKFESLNGIDVGAALLDAVDDLVGAPRRISFGNDADAFGLGEWLAGALQESDRCAAITLGTGVGACFLTEGIVVNGGPSVPPKGEAYLIEIDGRPLEDLVSSRALRSAYRLATGRILDVREIADSARAGDLAAARVLADYATTLGRALRPYLLSFAADQLVIGGSITGAWDLLESDFRRGLDAPGLRVVISGDPERSALIGAAQFTRQQS